MYVGIFARTFMQLATPALVAAAAADWINGDRKLNASLLGLALLVAFLGACTATGWSYVRSPATDRLGASGRSAVEAALGVVVLLPVNAVQDIVLWPAAFAGGVSVIIGAFVATWFSWRPPAQVPVATSQ